MKYNAKISKAYMIKDNTLHIVFNDGVEGDVVFDIPNLSDMFSALNDKKYLSHFKINQAGMICWDNGVDLATGWICFDFKKGKNFIVSTKNTHLKVA